MIGLITNSMVKVLAQDRRLWVIGDYRFGEQQESLLSLSDGRKFMGSVNAGVMGEGTYTALARRSF